MLAQQKRYYSFGKVPNSQRAACHHCVHLQGSLSSPIIVGGVVTPADSCSFLSYSSYDGVSFSDLSLSTPTANAATELVSSTLALLINSSGGKIYRVITSVVRPSIITLFLSEQLLQTLTSCDHRSLKS